MAHIASNMIAQTRTQFSDQAHYVLGAAHGHHFAAVAPPKRQRPPQQQQEEQGSPPPRKRAAARPQMMEVDAPPADPEELMAQKQQKIAAHNARINALNNSKAKAPEEPQEPVPK